MMFDTQAAPTSCNKWLNEEILNKVCFKQSVLSSVVNPEICVAERIQAELIGLHLPTMEMVISPIPTLYQPLVMSTVSCNIN